MNGTDFITVNARGPTKTASIRLPRGDHIAKQIAARGDYYERDLLDAIRGHGLVGVYADIGAHCGNHAAFFALECPSTTVFAIEPHRPSFEALCETVRALPVTTARAYWGAVHDTWRSGRSVAGPRGNTGMAKVEDAGDDGEVFVWKLDRLVEAHPGRLAVVKIDVEGAEMAVLRSGRASLAEHRPLVAVECQTDEARDEVTAWLAELGYVRDPRTYCRTPTYIFVGS